MQSMSVTFKQEQSVKQNHNSVTYIQKQSVTYTGHSTGHSSHPHDMTLSNFLTQKKFGSRPIDRQRILHRQRTKKQQRPKPDCSSPYSLVESLALTQHHPRQAQFANVFIANFGLHREYLLTYCYSQINKDVFDSKLPVDLVLIWNKRLHKSAGQFLYEAHELHISEQVCDSADKFILTLAHEMCHAATTFINKKPLEKHGHLFKYWTSLVKKVYPQIPAITTYHSFF